MKCPKCKTEMEEFMLPTSASITFGGPNSGVMRQNDMGKMYECPKCGHEVETDLDGTPRKSSNPLGSTTHPGYGNR